MEICVVEAVAYLLVALQVGGGRVVLVELVMLLPAADPHHEGCGGRAEQPASGEEQVWSLTHFYSVVSLHSRVIS